MLKRATREKLNNSGFSLVEVIIGMVILTVVTIPILSCFITAFRINQKSKEVMRESAAAQSIMEGFKAHSIKSLEGQFLGTEAFRVYNDAPVVGADGLSVSSIDGFSCTLLDKLGHNTTDISSVDQTKEQVFVINGLNYQGAKYDVTVKLNPLTRDHEGNPLSDAFKGTRDITYIENMNGFQDAIYNESVEDIPTKYYELLSDVASELNSRDYEFGTIGGSETGIRISDLNMSKFRFTRESEVNITATTAKIVVKYMIHVSSYPYMNNDGSYGSYSDDIIRIVEKEFYNNADTGANFENVFLFVYPAYSSALSGCPFEEDKFTIKCVPDTKKVFFVKQKRVDGIVNLNTCEESYSPVFNLNNVDLYHNLRDNLADGSELTSVTFHSLGSTVRDGLAIEDEQVFVYDVEVVVVNQADSSLTYTLKGTMNDN